MFALRLTSTMLKVAFTRDEGLQLYHRLLPCHWSAAATAWGGQAVADLGGESGCRCLQHAAQLLVGERPQAEMASKVVDQVVLDKVGHACHALLVAPLDRLLQHRVVGDVDMYISRPS